MGRSVGIDDWRSLHEDAILRLLLDAAESPFNPGDEPLVLQSLENATGLERPAVESICRALAQQDLLELQGSPRIEAARLTQAGRASVLARLVSTPA